MIATKLYIVQAYMPIDQKDEHGRSKVDWRRIYGQINNGTFEYTINEEEAKQGDFSDSIPDCKAVHQASQEERTIKLIQQVKNKKYNPKVLEIKIEEGYNQDLNKLSNIIDSFNKNAKEIGRPLLLNVHSGRGVSALSRGPSHSNYRGLVTVLLILLIISNLKYILKEGSDKGWIVGSNIYEFVTNPSSKVTIFGLLEFCFALNWMVVCPVISFLSEKLIGANQSIPRSIMFGTIFLNMTYCLVFPLYYIRVFTLNPLACSFYLMFACIWFFKFLSYHHIWHDIRYHVIKANKVQDIQKDKSQTNIDDVKTEKSHRRKATITKEDLGDKLDLPGSMVDEVLAYPKNVRAWDVWVFLFIPTLCFQLKYPFYKEVNIIKFLYRITECFIFIIIWVSIITEISIPIVLDVVHAVKTEQYVDALYHFLRLSVPNTYAWLFQFYLGFHSYLNAWAEITGFSDKNFYEDWWNSSTLGEYWRKWNLPMHYWLTRHLYYPMRRRKISRGLAMGIVFAFSAVFHEYMLAGCFGVFTMLGFNAMMCQLPIILIQDKFKKYISPEAGNVFFWVFFCVIGQPGGMVAMYYVLV